MQVFFSLVYPVMVNIILFSILIVIISQLKIHISYLFLKLKTFYEIACLFFFLKPLFNNIESQKLIVFLSNKNLDESTIKFFLNQLKNSEFSKNSFFIIKKFNSIKYKSIFNNN